MHHSMQLWVWELSTTALVQPSTDPAFMLRLSGAARISSFAVMHRQSWIPIEAWLCRWGRTLSMNAALCEELGSDGAFPSPAQVPQELESHKLARSVSHHAY